MSRYALLGKEVYELFLERRFLLTLLLFSLVFSVVMAVMVGPRVGDPSSPFEFLWVVFFGGPLLVGLLVVVLAGDAVARERQERTLHLLFTVPATRTGYVSALLVAHLVAFAAFAVLLMGFSMLVGVAMGWVAVKATLLLLVVSLLPLFLTLDLLVLVSSTRLGNARASLLVALVLVIGLWSTGAEGPFGWALERLAWWSGVSAWHPFDLAGASSRHLLERGVLLWTPFWKALLEAVVLGALAWLSFVTKEVGR